jgi:hypothetical protein
MDSRPRDLLSWLLTTAISVPLGWWVARGLSQPGSDLVWAALAFGPPWVVLRLLVSDFRWNAFFFGFVPPVLAFEALEGMQVAFRQAAALVALAPLVVYAILGFSNLMLSFGAGAAELARQALDPGRDAGALPRRLGRWLRSSAGSAVRWYAIWLGGAAVGFGLAFATETLARAVGILSGAWPLEVLGRVLVGLAAGGSAWALLWRPRSSPRAPESQP